MNPSRIIAGSSVGLAAVLLVLAAPATAGAHVTVDATSTAPGTASTLSFTIEHGCDASPTTSVTIAIPDEVSAVTPIANAGWSVDFDLAAADRTMTYTAQTPLPSAVHDTLVLDVTLRDDLADGTVLAFPTTQMCEVGSLAWDAADAGADSPAPLLTVSAPSAPEAPAAATTGTGPVAIAAFVAALAAVALTTIALRRQQTKGAQR